MCMSSPSAPAPTPPPSAPPPPETPTAVQPATEANTKSKRKGTSALRIDMAQPSSGGGSGLNIPT